VCYPSGSCIWSPEAEAGERWNPHGVRAALRDVPGLKLQPAELQSRFKVSYYAVDADAACLNGIGARLRESGIDADIIYSSNRDLDVLPRGVNKGSAVARLARWAAVPPGQVMVAGDTGNDLSMFEQGFRGIVVGNAHSVLRSLTGDRVYQARGCFAEGVLEGVHYWTSEQSRYESPRPDVSKGDRGSAHECDGSGVQRL